MDDTTGLVDITTPQCEYAVIEEHHNVAFSDIPETETQTNSTQVADINPPTAPRQQIPPVINAPTDIPRVVLGAKRPQVATTRRVFVRKVVQTNKGPLVVVRAVIVPQAVRQTTSQQQRGSQGGSTTVPIPRQLPKKSTNSRTCIAVTVIITAIITAIVLSLSFSNVGNNDDNNNNNGYSGYVVTLTSSLIFSDEFEEILEDTNSQEYKYYTSQMETEIDHILLLTTSTYKNYDLSRFRDINVGLYSSDLIFHIFMKSAVKTSTIDNALTSGISSYDSNAILSLLSISYVTVVSNKGLKYPSTPRMPTAPTYTSADCTSFEFTCESSRCISSTQQCNGYSECMDMSDEDWRRCYDCQPVTINACTNVLPYTSAYFPNKVVTTQEMATNMLSKIEDYLHCHEYATLFACLTYAPSCPSDAGFIQRPCRLFCYSVLYSCLNVLRELAIQFSCSDLDNNAGCWQPQSGTCDVMEFRCNDGRCIHVSGKCDGANDCWDESDEDNCNYHDGDCNEFQYRCNDNSKCIPLGWRCDDTNDCPDASDEADCYQTSTRCSYSEFTCANRTCIPISKRCDSNNDCGDNSDETVALCGSVCPDDGEQMSCSNVHKCVMKTQECDDNKDCPDNSDESKCVKMFGSMLYAKYNASWIPICANGWYNAYSRVVCQQLGFGNVSKTYYYTNDGFDKSATLRPSVTVNDLKNIRNALEVSTETCSNDQLVSLECTGIGCGLLADQPSSRIVGGSSASDGNWPWIVSLQNLTDSSHFCGGTLINTQWIVTAAHCLYQSEIVDIVDISSIKAVMGIKYTNSYVSSKQTRTISTFYIHPEYNYRTYVNDIALLKLTSPVTYTDRVRPACIALEDIVLPAGRLGYIAGWGITEEDAEEVSTILQEAHVPLVALEECAGLLNIELHPGMQCAGYLTGGIDTCQGDSGGPLMIENTDDGRWYLYGVTSFGYGCARANMPGIYTKVNKYTDFLEEIIGF